jgi:hypothetical protein
VASATQEEKVGMTLMGRRGLIRVVSVRYALADRQPKTKILDEFTANTSYGRKYAIAVLREPPAATAPKARRQRRHTYPSSLIDVLVLAWRACECICSKRFKPFLPEMVSRLQAFGHVRLTDQERALLARMSTSTIDRLLKPFRDAARPRGKSTTRPGPGLPCPAEGGQAVHPCLHVCRAQSNPSGHAGDRPGGPLWRKDRR